jgi:hydrogenase maturation protein HypF
VRVQHHHAHVAAVAAEHGLSGPVLGIARDGMGLGSDQALWGGEVLVVDGARMKRLACLPRFRLPGGDRAACEPWRCALGLLFAADPELARTYGSRRLDPKRLDALLQALARGFNAPVTSRAGRLFDAVAALAGFVGAIAFEGQAAMNLEFAASGAKDVEPYPLELEELPVSPESQGSSLPAFVQALCEDVATGMPVAEVSSRFHAALTAAAVRAAARAGLPRVVLSGGCFQNRLLVSGLVQALEAAGHRVFLAGQIPCNDGGISAGQASVAGVRFESSNFDSRFWASPHSLQGHSAKRWLEPVTSTSVDPIS